MKESCDKCGGIWRYKGGSCVGCKKNRNNKSYQEKRKKGIRRLSGAWKSAKKAGNKKYESQTQCKVCGGTERYVSSGGCVACQMKRSKDDWRRIVFRKAEAATSIRNPNVQLFFNIKMDELIDLEREKTTGLDIRDNLERMSLEVAGNHVNRGQLLGSYIRAKEKDQDWLKRTAIYKQYKYAKAKFGQSPANIEFKFSLFYAEAALYEFTRHFLLIDPLPAFKFFESETQDLQYVLEVMQQDPILQRERRKREKEKAEKSKK